MPQGGLGNLIALPLQKAARRKNNSEFVDGGFEPYDDQWAFLSSVGKIDSDRVRDLAAELGDGPELGRTQRRRRREGGVPGPWETCKPAKVHLKKSDFPGQIDIVKSNMLFIPKEGISQRALNRIKRLGVLQKPDVFTKHQAMRLPTYTDTRGWSHAPTKLGDTSACPEGAKASWRPS